METKRIFRSRTDRMLGGVAGGIGAYLNIDPLFIRLAFVILSLANGTGALIYLVLWLLLPNEGSTASDARAQVRESVDEMKSTAEGFADQVRRAFER